MRHYWIKLALYNGEDSTAMFSLFMRNYHNQGLIRIVHEAARHANNTVTTPAKETFIHLLLADKKHADRTQIDSRVQNAALFMGAAVGPNEDYLRIHDGIYSSIGLVSKEKEAEDRGAEGLRS